jgi:hypothetical protein
MQTSSVLVRVGTDYTDMSHIAGDVATGHGWPRGHALPVRHCVYGQCQRLMLAMRGEIAYPEVDLYEANAGPMALACTAVPVVYCSYWGGVDTVHVKRTTAHV